MSAAAAAIISPQSGWVQFHVTQNHHGPCDDIVWVVPVKMERQHTIPRLSGCRCAQWFEVMRYCDNPDKQRIIDGYRANSQFSYLCRCYGSFVE